MSSRCKSCMYRAADGAGSGGGCAYLQITGKSRLKSVYKRLGVNWMTDAVRAAGLQKRRALYDQGLTDQEIARRLGLKTQTVTKWRWDMGLGVNDAERRRPIVDGARLKQLYREGLTDRQIAAQMGLKVDTVRSWRQRRHMPVNQDHKGHRITWETKALQLHAVGKTDLEIAKAVGRSRSSVSMWRRKKGLPINQAIQGPKKEKAHGDL